MKNTTPKPEAGKIASRKAKKPSSAASNVAQWKKATKKDERVGALTIERVRHGKNPETGALTLTAIFPRKAGREPHLLNLDFLLEFPNLQPLFTDALLHWGATLTSQTRADSVSSLRRYFFGYLRSNWSSLITPEQIDDEVLAGFKNSLLNRSGKNGKGLHPTTVTTALGDLRSVLSAIPAGPLASVAQRIAEQVPPGPTGAHHKAEPIEVLGMEDLLNILEAAEREVLAIENRFANGQMLLAEGRRRLESVTGSVKNKRTAYRDFSTCLAALESAYPVLSPNYDELVKTHPAIAYAVKEIHGQRAIDSYLYPSSRDLVPFVLLLGIVTVFNSETILSLKWADIDFNKSQAGIPAIEIIGKKGRAAQDLVRLLDPNAATTSQLSLKRTLECLREITNRIRPYLSDVKADYLFVFVPTVKPRNPSSFGKESETRAIYRSGQASWHLALKKFIDDNKLTPFNLAQLRPTILDLVQFMDGSLEAARKVGNHRRQVTTWTHYTSGGVKARYRERIGEIILLRDRWLQTAGAIDPRRLTLQQDKGAATPGFSCWDPFDSPRPNQHKGKLCKDYGGCPSCPLAAAYPSDPLSVAQYTALEFAIYRSQSTMNARTWVERWTPVLADLASLSTWIPPDVLADSRKIFITLPNVGGKYEDCDSR